MSLDEPLTHSYFAAVAVKEASAAPGVPRAHLLRGLTRIEPGRPAWALGLRVAVALALPLTIGLVTGRLDLGLVAALGSLNVGLADPGGAPRTRAAAMTSATVLNAFAIFIGTAAGEAWWVAVPLMFVIGFCSGIAVGFGSVAGNGGFLASVLFIVGLGLHGSWSVAGAHLWLCLTGGAWAMVVALSTWWLRPFGPAEEAVAATYRALGDLLAATAGPGSPADATRPVHVGEDGRTGEEARTRLNSAREILGATRAVRAGEDVTGVTLIDLASAGEGILDRIEGLLDQVDTIASTALLPLIWPELARAVTALAAVLHSLASRMTHARAGNDPIPLSALDDAVLAVDAAVSVHRQNVIAGQEDLAVVVSLRPITLALVSLADRCHDATQLVQDLVPGVRSHQAGAAGFAGRDTGAIKLRSLSARLRHLLHPESLVLRHGLRVATVTAACVAIFLILGLPKGYWVALTAVVVLKPYLGGTLQRTMLRVVGTVLGGLVAAALIFAITNPAAMVGVVLALTFGALSLLSLNYGLSVVMLTPLVVLLVDLGHPGDSHVAVARVVNTLVGGGLALAGSYLLWSSSESVDVRLRLADAFEADQVYGRAVMHCYERRGSQAELNRAHQRAGLAADNVAATFQRLLAEISHKRGRVDLLWEAISANRRLYASFAALEAHLDTFTGKYQVLGLPGFAAALERELGEAAATLRGQDSSHHADGVDSALAEVQRHVAGLRLDRAREIAAGDTEITALATEVRDESFVAAELDRLAEALSTVRRLAPALAPQGLASSPEA